MSKAPKKKKVAKHQRRSGTASRNLPTGRLNPGVTRTACENVIEIVKQGRGLDRALEIAVSAFFLTDHLIRRFEAENPLSQPLACQESCDACCHNLVELTPPEALLIGHHIHQYFPPAQKDLVLAQVTRNLTLTRGKSKAAIAIVRQDLPCPLLCGRMCSVYPIRPLVCRAMHSLNRERCEAELRSGSLSGSTYYAHHHEIALSVSAGLLEGCRVVGCQAGTLSLAQAFHDFFSQENCVERWITGEAVFGF
jgi:hypothetical protein